jgi:hypothetical protein
MDATLVTTVSKAPTMAPISSVSPILRPKLGGSARHFARVLSLSSNINGRQLNLRYITIRRYR